MKKLCCLFCVRRWEVSLCQAVRTRAKPFEKKAIRQIR